MTTAIDGHQPFLGWSPTNPRMVTYQKEVNYSLGIWHIDYTHKIRTRGKLPWINSLFPSPSLLGMVNHIPKNGHPPFPGCSPTIPRMVLHHHLSFPRFSTGQSTNQLLSPCWSTNMPRTVTHHHHSQVSHQGNQGGSFTIQRMFTSISWMVIQYLKDGQPPTLGWSPSPG